MTRGGIPPNERLGSFNKTESDNSQVGFFIYIK